jgi:hypothetical protein
MKILRATLLCGILTTFSVVGQIAGPTNNVGGTPVVSQGAASPAGHWQAAEAVRAQCIQNRRIICGRILKLLPGGFIVDSGYTSLMRQPLNRSWLIPGTVTTKREPNLVEKNEPDCICVGLVFVTDPPKLRHGKPKLLDYVVLTAFPTGHFTYKPVGTFPRTVRRFSGSLPAAVSLNLQQQPAQ